MDKEKPSNPNQSLPPQSVRFTHNVKSEPSTSGAPPQPPQPPQPQTGSDINNSCSRLYSQDISGMPDNPPKNPRHRRAHSEIITLPDDIDISFDNDMVDAAAATGGGGPSYSDDTEEDLFSMYLDMDKFNSGSTFQVGEGSGSGSGGAGAGAGGVAAFQGSMLAAEGGGGKNAASGSRIRHQHSQSMDGSTSIMIKPEMLMSMSASEEFPPGDSKKAMSAAKLAELALIDPKRAKRIWANRQSAARSKERKMRYIAELERKLQTLQTEATTLSAQLSLLQRDTNGLTAENSELKLRLQTMEQQVHLQDGKDFLQK
ncbi:hypothetical protein ACFE04_007610 [Oxalis oulophora]